MLQVVCFLLGNSPSSEFYIPMFRNTLSVPSLQAGRRWNRQCSETSAYKIQPPENCPEESIQHSEHGESLKSHVVTLQKTTQPVPYMHHSTIAISHIACIYFFMVVIFDPSGFFIEERMFLLLSVKYQNLDLLHFSLSF